MFEKMKELYESGLSLSEVAFRFETTVHKVVKLFDQNSYKRRTMEDGKKIHDGQYKRVKDISGKRFGRFVVVEFVDTRKRQSRWLCKCDCGNTKVIYKGNLTTGNTKSCGCLSLEVRITHGESKTRLYRIWEGIRRRCSNIKHEYWECYGGRGISVCQEWQDSYEVFRDWAKINGYDKSLTIDRKDNDGNYEPSNCRFITSAENSRNKRDTKLNWDKVNQIRELRKTTKMSSREIGYLFGVRGSCIRRIVRNKSWMA